MNYISIFGVEQPTHTGHKLRVVANCKQKNVHAGKSVNDCVNPPPQLTVPAPRGAPLVSLQPTHPHPGPGQGLPGAQDGHHGEVHMAIPMPTPLGEGRRRRLHRTHVKVREEDMAGLQSAGAAPRQEGCGAVGDHRSKKERWAEGQEGQVPRQASLRDEHRCSEVGLTLPLCDQVTDSTDAANSTDAADSTGAANSTDAADSAGPADNEISEEQEAVEEASGQEEQVSEQGGLLAEWQGGRIPRCDQAAVPSIPSDPSGPSDNKVVKGQGDGGEEALGQETQASARSKKQVARRKRQEEEGRL